LITSSRDSGSITSDGKRLMRQYILSYNDEVQRSTRRGPNARLE
jgi:hypothetical protein